MFSFVVSDWLPILIPFLRKELKMKISYYYIRYKLLTTGNLIVMVLAHKAIASFFKVVWSKSSDGKLGSNLGTRLLIQ